LPIGRLPVEAKQCCAEAGARNLRELVEICVEIGHQQIVEAGLAGSIAAGNQIIAVADQHPAQAQSALRVEAEQPPQRARSRHDIDRAGIAGDRRTRHVCGMGVFRARRRADKQGAR